MVVKHHRLVSQILGFEQKYDIQSNQLKMNDNLVEELTELTRVFFFDMKITKLIIKLLLEGGIKLIRSGDWLT